MAKRRRPEGWRVFFGLDLPVHLRNRLAVEALALRLPRRVAPEDLHLTLVFLGEVPPDRLQALHEAAEALSMPGFALRIEGLGLFGRSAPNALWAGLAPEPALEALQAKLETALRRAGATPEKRRFVPHITLGRFPPQPPEEAARLERAVVAGSGTGSDLFEVRDFILFRSHLGGDPPHYEELARYPLRTRPPLTTL
ncbi:RNA 2',3'-cyclic phosphodiesterase [Tabrizicola sp. DMG-N-6]|uniref:RNA 2',3'-cyclic phosphodiesterase n=2 Tax=Szabonella alba TaxID=2804194 RepID=A0A8K0V6L2_9RHOB|nr:RNA 2',3'-cyclic phosphodiesterase [Szabonella alba]